MKPEILLKAFVQYQSEAAFRDLVAATLDEVYATALRIVPEAPQVAEAIALSAYVELACQAPALGKDVALAGWLRQRTCKLAVRILRAEDRAVDWAALKREKNARPIPAAVQPAPPGLAIRICQTIFLNGARRQGRGRFPPRAWWPAWIPPRPACGVAVCALVIIAWWTIPVHRHNPIVRSPGSLMTPSAFAQLASPEEGGSPLPSQVVHTNAGTNTIQK